MSRKKRNKSTQPQADNMTEVTAPTPLDLEPEETIIHDDADVNTVGAEALHPGGDSDSSDDAVVGEDALDEVVEDTGAVADTADTVLTPPETPAAPEPAVEPVQVKAAPAANRIPTRAEQQDMARDDHETITRTTAETVAGLINNVYDAHSRYTAGFRFIGLLDHALRAGMRNGRCIGIVVDTLESNGVSRQHVMGLMSAPRFSADQREFVKTMAMLIFDGRTVEGRKMLARSIDRGTLRQKIGDSRYAVVGRWLGLDQ